MWRGKFDAPFYLNRVLHFSMFRLELGWERLSGGVRMYSIHEAIKRGVQTCMEQKTVPRIICKSVQCILSKSHLRVRDQKTVS